MITLQIRRHKTAALSIPYYTGWSKISATRIMEITLKTKYVISIILVTRNFERSVYDVHDMVYHNLSD